MRKGSSLDITQLKKARDLLVGLEPLRGTPADFIRSPDRGWLSGGAIAAGELLKQSPALKQLCVVQLRKLAPLKYHRESLFRVLAHTSSIPVTQLKASLASLQTVGIPFVSAAKPDPVCYSPLCQAGVWHDDRTQRFGGDPNYVARFLRPVCFRIASL